MMTLLSIDQLATVTGGADAAPAAPAAAPALDQGQTDLANTLVTGNNANLCSALDRQAVTLGNTPLGQAMLGNADQCWVNLRTSLAPGLAPAQ